MDGRAGLTKREDGTAELHLEHVKNGEAGYTLTVRLAKVTVELEDGAFETVAAEIEKDPSGAPCKGTRRNQPRAGLKPDQRTAIKAIARAVLEKPMPRPDGEDIPRHVTGTTEGTAISYIARLVPRTTSSGRERADHQQREHAKRIFGALHDKYLVRVVDGFCWLDPRAEVAE
jgi:hypothetical protein